MIRLRTFNLEPLKYSCNVNHYNVCRELSQDQAVYDYISKHFDTWVNEPTSTDKYEIGGSYMIMQNNNIIGMMGSTSMDQQGVVDLWYCLLERYRGQGLGDKILSQISMFMIENIDGLNDIKLEIHKNNMSSRILATKNGFNDVGISEQNGTVTYKYFSKR